MADKWAEQAARHLRYLAMCRTDAERIEYLALVLRATESDGVLRGGREMGEAVTGKDKQHGG